MATITGTFVNPGATIARKIGFVPSSFPAADSGGSIVSSKTFETYTNNSGAISVTLYAGFYEVHIDDSDDFFLIEVTSSNADVADIIVAGGGGPVFGGLAIDGVTALRARTAYSNNAVVYLRYISTAGDGGAGIFIFDSSSSTADDSGLTSVKPNAIDSGDPGRWLRAS